MRRHTCIQTFAAVATGVCAILLVIGASANCASPPQPPEDERVPETSAAEREFVPDFADVYESIHMLPAHPPESWDHEGMSPAHAAVANKERFDAWRRYEDGYVSFQYPDAPEVTLTVVRAGETFPVTGGPVSSCDNSFMRAYRLCLGKTTYGAILLTKRDEFDDGICLCGAISFRKYLVRDGSLYRFSLLERGNIVKKVQILRGGMRATVFEITHVPMSEAVYLKLALGFRIKGEAFEERAARDTVVAKYGFFGRLGFLEKGMDAAAVKAVMGASVWSTPAALGYSHTSDEHLLRTDVVVRLCDGRFRGFGFGDISYTNLPPPRGSVQWICEKTQEPFLVLEGLDLGDEKDYDLGPLTADAAAYIFERFLVLAPSADSADWDTLCRAVCDLHDKGHKDLRVLPVIKKRFLDLDLQQHWAAWALHKLDSDGSQPVFAERAGLLREALKDVGPDEFVELDVSNLMSFMNSASPSRKALLIACMDHPNKHLRADGYFRCSGIPAEKALPRLIKGLSEPDAHNRFMAAARFRDEYGDASHIEMLKVQLRVETDDSTKKALEKAILRLSE